MPDVLERIVRGLFERFGLLPLYERHGWRMARVVMVGSVGFVIQTLIFEVVGIQLALVAASTAAVIGGECAILSNFFLNNKFSFNDAEHSSSLLVRLFRFHLVASGSLFIQWLFVFLAERMTENLLILRGAYLLAIGVGFLFNYVGYYLFVWRRR